MEIMKVEYKTESKLYECSLIIKVPLYIKNETLIKLVKDVAMIMEKTMIKTYNSTEFSNETFEDVFLI